MEADLTRYAVSQGFHEGKLKRPERAHKPKPSLREARLQSAETALKKWETKQKRSETAVKKYRQKIRYYEKVLTQPELSGEA
jgi:hypothetical protein